MIKGEITGHNFISSHFNSINYIPSLTSYYIIKGIKLWNMSMNLNPNFWGLFFLVGFLTSILGITYTQVDVYLFHGILDNISIFFWIGLIFMSTSIANLIISGKNSKLPIIILSLFSLFIASLPVMIYPLIPGAYDQWVHLYGINLFLKSGSTIYSWGTGFHIMYAIISYFTQIVPEILVKFIPQVLALVLVLSFYSSSKNLYKDEHIGLLALLFSILYLSVSMSAIIPNALATLLIGLIVCSLVRDNKSNNSILVTYSLFVTLIHGLYAIILLVFYACYLFASILAGTKVIDLIKKYSIFAAIYVLTYFILNTNTAIKKMYDGSIYPLINMNLASSMLFSFLLVSASLFFIHLLKNRFEILNPNLAWTQKYIAHFLIFAFMSLILFLFVLSARGQFLGFITLKPFGSLLKDQLFNIITRLLFLASFLYGISSNRTEIKTLAYATLFMFLISSTLYLSIPKLPILDALIPLRWINLSFIFLIPIMGFTLKNGLSYLNEKINNYRVKQIIISLFFVIIITSSVAYVYPIQKQPGHLRYFQPITTYAAIVFLNSTTDDNRYVGGDTTICVLVRTIAERPCTMETFPELYTQDEFTQELEKKMISGFDNRGLAYVLLDQQMIIYGADFDYFEGKVPILSKKAVAKFDTNIHLAKIYDNRGTFIYKVNDGR